MFDVHCTTAPAYTFAVDGTVFRCSDANEAALALRSTGLVGELRPGFTPAECFAAPVATVIEARYRTCRESGHACSYPSRTSDPADSRRWTTTLVPTFDVQGAVVSIVTILSNAVGDAERPMVADDKPAQAIGAIDGGFWVYDIATGRFETSRSLTELLAGPGRESLDLAEYAGYFHADDLKSADLLSPPGDRSSVDFRVVVHDGRILWLQSNRRTVRDANGTPLRVVGLVLDVTVRKTAMQTLETEATTDSLTGLMNRRSFEQWAARLWRDGIDWRTGPGVTLIDIDDFKTVNDRNGHLAGDELLRQVARRLSGVIRRGDHLSRLGGDEFAVLSSDDASARALEDRIRLQFAKPFQLGDRSLFVGASVGSSARRLTDRGIDQILGRADAALYSDKASRSALRA